ncbi:MAG: bifunctional ADP-heptose synthase [Bacteroidota bacterium]|nr:bifunctional ADP-heptose synthase [Bacteroidota bacterium]
MERARELLERCRGRCIAVVGDVMVDRYFWGSVTRISPEAPVPVVDFEVEEVRLGGAANVAHNLHSLGLKPLLVGVIGQDVAGDTLLELARGLGFETEALFRDPARPTTEKIRILGNRQHLVRLDREVRTPVDGNVVTHVLHLLEKVPDIEALIFQDYNKGMLTPELIRAVIELMSCRGVPVLADPKRDNFFAYVGVTLFKPNRREAAQALQRGLRSVEDVRWAACQLQERLRCRAVLLTLGEEGMFLREGDGRESLIPARAHHVADVSGAGDTVIATVAAALVAGATFQEAALLSNFAAGVVCAEPGVVPIDPQALLGALSYAEC